VVYVNFTIRHREVHACSRGARMNSAISFDLTLKYCGVLNVIQKDLYETAP